MTGSFQSDAMFITSYSKPCPSAPSPKKHTATCPVFKRFAERAAPVAIPALPPTMALSPRSSVAGRDEAMGEPVPLENRPALACGAVSDVSFDIGGDDAAGRTAC